MAKKVSEYTEPRDVRYCYHDNEDHDEDLVPAGMTDAEMRSTVSIGMGR